jgi:hypothetical protein
MTPFGNPLDRVHVPDPGEYAIPDHAAAFADILRGYAKQIANGRSAEDAANELLPIVRVAARRT